MSEKTSIQERAFLQDEFHRLEVATEDIKKLILSAADETVKTMLNMKLARAIERKAQIGRKLFTT